MNAAMKRLGTACRNLASPVVAPILAIALVAVIGGASTVPAYAQDSGGRYEQHQRDERYHHHRQYDRDRYRSNSYDRPAYVYAPPPVYYAPPPSPPVIDFVFPLRFR